MFCMFKCVFYSKPANFAYIHCTTQVPHLLVVTDIPLREGNTTYLGCPSLLQMENITSPHGAIEEKY